MMVPAIALTVVHLNIYDFYKERFLRATRLRGGGEGQDPAEVERRLAEAKAKGPLIYIAVKHVLLPHLRRQQALIKALNPGAIEGADRIQPTPQTAEIYRKNNVWPMRLWAVVSLAPHSYLMAICAMADRLDVYFYIRLFAMNAVFLAAIVWQRRATAKTYEELAAAEVVEGYGSVQPAPA